MLLIVYFIIDFVIKLIYNVKYTVLKKKFQQQNMSINSAGNT